MRRLFKKKSALKRAYRIGNRLGAGNFAEVYRAERVADGAIVAIKMIDKSKVEDLASVERELATQRNVQHEHLIHIYEVFYESKRICIVQELAAGGELFDRIVARGSYTEAMAAKTFRELCSALESLHAIGIVHGDLKPENILYASPADDAPLKICDFGQAFKLGSDDNYKKACGTPGYVAPEELRNRGYGTPADMWSVGVLLYTLLCGFPPFYEEELPALFDQILKAEYDFPSPWWDAVSNTAKDVVCQLLVKEPEGRLTASAALALPWLNGGAAQTTLSVEAMKRYNADLKFRAIPTAGSRADEEEDTEQVLATGPYSTEETLLVPLRAGDVRLVRASWLLRRAGYEHEAVSLEVRDRRGNTVDHAEVRKWVPRTAPQPLPCRQDLETDDDAAFLPVGELESALAAFRDSIGAQAARRVRALPVVSVSYCWELPSHPDPAARVLLAVAHALAGEWNQHIPTSGLPLYNDWGFEDVGVFLDWCSLFQKHASGGRSEMQADSFKRALAQMEMWYAHAQTSVYLIGGQDAHLHLPRAERGWPYFEACVTHLLKEAPRREIFELSAGPRYLWDPVIMAGTPDGGEASDVEGHAGEGLTTLRHQPPLAPSRFAEALHQKTFTNNGDADQVVQLYAVTMAKGFSELCRLQFPSLDWADSDIEELSVTLSDVACPRLVELNLSCNPRVTTLTHLDAPLSSNALAGLTTLNLSLCTRLATLPTRLDTLARLQTLDLSGCVALEALPKELAQCMALRVLLLGGCSSLTALGSLSDLTRLRTLNVEACVRLESMPDLSNISELDVINLPATLAAWEQGGRKAYHVEKSALHVK